MLYDIAELEDSSVVSDLLPTLPDELSAWIGVTQIPAAAHFPEHLWSRNAASSWCFPGPHDRGRQALARYALAIRC